MMRLQKYLAACGVASRRKGEELIKDGRVIVNGQKITEMGFLVDETCDKVLLDGNEVKLEETKRYIILNKPRGYITTVSDQFARKTVMELLDDVPERIFPIGRLDQDTEGLLLMTNDGEFANSIAHPKKKIDKVYVALVSGQFDENKAEALRRGVVIDDRMTHPAKVKILKDLGRNKEVMVTIHEGRNRQVRKMFEAVGCHVRALSRKSVGKFNIGNLPLGKWRELTKEEMDYVAQYKNIK